MDTATTPRERLITMAARDARMLALVGRRQVEWDPATAARIVVGTNAVACYSVLPMDVMCVLATPAQVGSQAVGQDVTVPLASYVGGLETGLAAGDEIGFDVTELPRTTPPIDPGVSLHQLPPRDGWQMPIHGVSSDVVPQVSDAIQEFQDRSAGLSSQQSTALAEEIWSRTAWAGLPLRVLHAARRLRMITDEPLRITASTCGPWKRLSTPRGQLFSYAAGIEARLGLSVVR
ncbi:MAG TPA: hypothetical protein VGP37_03305 [Candidatus Nanopelagicales bacterium]|nr:hypothetical protein [Candidatus Nanopelagicales bacterium]